MTQIITQTDNGINVKYIMFLFHKVGFHKLRASKGLRQVPGECASIVSPRHFEV